MGVFVQIDGKRIELTGSQAEAAQAHVDKLQADGQRMEQKSADRVTARASAIKKLAGLGLTADEIAALVG